MIKKIISFLTLAVLLEAYYPYETIIDDLNIKTQETYAGVYITFKTLSHINYDKKDYNRKFNEYQCNIYDNSTGRFIVRKKSKSESYNFNGIEIKFDKTNLSIVRVICKSKIFGRRFTSRDTIDLHNTYNTSMKNQETEKTMNNQYSRYTNSPNLNKNKINNLKKFLTTPNIFIKETKMFNIKKINFRHSEKRSLIIYAENGNFILKIKDLRNIVLYNISSKVRKKLETLSSSNLKYKNETTKERIKLLIN